jgi:antitoxin component YwqK of YwqJK toxin-antitoxin module
MEGQGTLYYPNGNKFVGEFKNNLRNGKGIQHYSDGRVEKGIWRDDEPINR